MATSDDSPLLQTNNSFTQPSLYPTTTSTSFNITERHRSIVHHQDRSNRGFVTSLLPFNQIIIESGGPSIAIIASVEIASGAVDIYPE